jgi:hypothetical protein
MIKCVLFPNREFTTKEELFKELKANEKQIIELKKSVVYDSISKGQIGLLTLDKINLTDTKFDVKKGFIYPVISTTNYLDSHDDVHFKSCFDNTVKDQQGKVHYTSDHKLELDSIIAWKDDVTMFVKEIDWSLVGKSYSGTTQALMFEIEESKVINQKALELIKAKKQVENSIRMRYIHIKLAINSNDDDYTENKSFYDSRINEIANKEVAIERGYFWGVEELGIFKEGSLVVAGGSNDATSIIYDKQEPLDDTLDKTEPLDNAQNEKEKELLKELLNKF